MPQFIVCFACVCVCRGTNQPAVVNGNGKAPHSPVNDKSDAASDINSSIDGKKQLRKRNNAPVFDFDAQEEAADQDNDDHESITSSDRDGPVMRRKHMWTDEEVADLYRGMQRYGSVKLNRWQKIKEDKSLKQLCGRSNVDLKDKWRWLVNHPDELKLLAKKLGKVTCL